MEKEPVKIFYPVFREGVWQGGTNYFNNLESITGRFLPHMQMESINLFSIPDSPLGFWEKLSGKKARKEKDTSVYLKSLSGNYPFCLFSIFPAHFKGKIRFPRIFWIPDFQVYYLPHLFTEEDILQRKTTFTDGAALADIVVLSSETARKDFEKFFPEHSSKGRVLRFVTEVQPKTYVSLPIETATRHHLPAKFFYVPNQFWKHKNHFAVIHALKKLKDEGVNANIVCSGSTSDARNPEYFEEFSRLIKEFGLESRAFILGMIPHEDVHQLIRQSVAVINPSFFEGWSTTVEEVKSIGKRIILSDIPVHREQNPPGGIYFDTSDAAALANEMKKIWSNYEAGPDAEMENNAKELLPVRVENFAMQFGEIINESFKLAVKQN